MTPEEIQRARELAQQWVAKGWADSADATDLWARAVLALTDQQPGTDLSKTLTTTLNKARDESWNDNRCMLAASRLAARVENNEFADEQQPEPVTVADLLVDLIVADVRIERTHAVRLIDRLLSRYTITHRAGV